VNLHLHSFRVKIDLLRFSTAIFLHGSTFFKGNDGESDWQERAGYEGEGESFGKKIRVGKGAVAIRGGEEAGAAKPGATAGAQPGIVPQADESGG
jgi:hypothetical protein